MKNTRFFLTSVIMAMLFTACESEKKESHGGYRYGIFILNEGTFMANNGSVSYFNPDSGTLVNNLFETINNRPLGDVVQAMGIAGDKAYIVVNGSGKVEIVNLETFEVLAEPMIISYPRYFLPVDKEKAYITSGNMKGYVYIADLVNDVVYDSIEAGFGPESMVRLGNYVYVANSGGWSVDSTLDIIDIRSDKVIATLVVGDVPSDMALDGDNNLWVYCKGYAEYNWEPPYDLISETEARLVKINTATNTIDWVGIVGTAGQYTGIPPKLAVSADGENLYYLRPDGVYKTTVRNHSLAGEPVFEGSYYGLDVNPETGDLYLFQSSFTGNGNMFIVDPVTYETETYMVGIGPSGAVFNLN
jgi:DNA-binding beta-propeller fold protein YncE